MFEKLGPKLSPLAVFCIVIVSSLVSFTFFWFHSGKIVSPLATIASFQFHSRTTPPSKPGSKLVYGFLPFWNVGKVVLQPELTHLAYFGLTIAKDGSFVSSKDPGYAKFKSETLAQMVKQERAEGTEIELVLSQFKKDDIQAFLPNPDARRRFLSSLDSVISELPITGINIDIEYAGEPDPALRKGLAQLITEIRTHFDKKETPIRLSIDMYPSAVSRPHIWDVAAIAPQVDLIVIMAYDFHRASSNVAGPVAPIFGGGENWRTDIMMHLQEFLKVVPSQKLLLGVPFYGYEWQTTDQQALSPTYPGSGATASFSRVQGILTEGSVLNLKENWDELALSPYLVFQRGTENYVLYYENSRSLSYKMDLVDQLNLGGIAIWALGYEAASRELWDVIKRKN